MPSIAARFVLHLMCTNCLRQKTQHLDVPEMEDAPTCVDDLAGSQALASVRFVCQGCEGAIAEVIGINQLCLEEAA